MIILFKVKIIMKNIVFRVDSSNSIGTGHLMRCITLANEFSKNSYNPIFISKNFEGNVNFLISENGFKYIQIEKEYFDDEINFVIDKINQYTPSWAIIDNYYVGSEYIKTLSKLNTKIFVIDDLANRELFVDMVLNQNIFSSEILYSNITNKNTKLLLGTKYCLLRDEFTRKKAEHKIINNTAQNFLITLGGSDPLNQTEKILSSFMLMDFPFRISPFIPNNIPNNFNISIVIGKSYKHIDTLSELADKIMNSKGINIRIYQQVTEMRPLIEWADICIAAGGTTCYEIMYLGVPMILLMIADNQKDVCETIAQMGLGVNLGWHENVDLQKINREIEKLSVNQAKRIEFSTLSQKYVDELGVKRVINELLSYKD